MHAAVIMALIMFIGCASQPRQQIPEEDIRARADRAFADLAAEEGGTPRRHDSNTEKPGSTGSATPRRQVDKPVPVKTGQRPDWIDGESRQYPSSLYLTAVGYGPDRPATEDKARAEMAKVFYTNIDSSNRTYQEILETTGGGKTTSMENINFEEITNVSTRKVLSGVRIAQVYRDSRSQPEFFALAILDRHQTAEILKEKIQELDHDLKRLLDAAQRHQDKLTQVKLLRTSMQKLVLRQAYNTELRIVDLNGRGIAPVVNFTEIKTRLSNVLLKDFLIALSVEGSKAEDVRRALVEALNQKGFSVSEQIHKASVLARGRIEINPIAQSASGWKFVRWKAYFDLVDQNGGAVFGSVQKTGKEGHLSLAQAEERAVRKIRKTLAAEISQDLSNFILLQGN